MSEELDIKEVPSNEEQHTFDSIISTSIKNIEADRENAGKLLKDLITHIDNQQTKWTHRDVGEVAAKYLETLQRSNEQLVKIASLIKKKSPEEKDGFNKKEKFDILDSIKEG